MRDLGAVILVVILVVVALSMATSLQWYRRGLARLRQGFRDRGESILAEIPAGEGLMFFTEDEQAYHWADRSIPKDRIRAARVLINGAPISVSRSRRFPHAHLDYSGVPESRPEGIERDRWDVAIETSDETVVVECGAIRERVSQELARRVFEAVKTNIEARDRA